MKQNRRLFLKSTLLSAPLVLGASGFHQNTVLSKENLPSKLKLALNAYSFNKPLRAGEMSLDDLLEFSASMNFDGLDLTAYYFPGYPSVPDKTYLLELKRKAFLLGVSINGTGIRTDFTETNPEKQKEQFEYITSWIKAAVLLGAPVIRVFAGKQNADQSWHEGSALVVEGLKKCCQIGAKHGVMIALQNHNGIIKTAEECLDIYERTNSPWLGLMVDIGSLRTGNPYDEIEKLAPYAITWQIKENVFYEGESQKTDVVKIVDIARNSGYRGYFPIETLGEGDPELKIKDLLSTIRKQL